MNPLDLLTIFLVIVALILGWRSGVIPQIAGLVGAVAGGGVALVSLPYLAEPLSSVDPALRPLVVIGGLLGAVALGETIGAGLGRVAGRGLGDGLLGAVDRTAGATFGAVQALLIVWLAGSLIAEGPVPRLAETAGGSTAVRTMALILPPPTTIAGGLGGLLDASGLPDVFVGFEPVAAPPVDRPADRAARAIAAAAERSTLKVSAATCGLSSVGSGFVIANGYVVTNAHVIAGASANGIRVSAVGGRLLDAVAVLFDPDLDVALLRVQGLTAAPLAFARVDPARGAVGATLGYPAGGPLTILPAAVAGRYPATGFDIYGLERVRRQILELRAEIDRGDSGGPLILADGTVGGVVFAEARTNPDVGYALSATEVQKRVTPAIGSRAVVGTGACLEER